MYTTTFFKSGVPHVDVPQDHAFFATMFHFASKHKIKYILTGANYSTECIRNPLEWMYFQSDSTQLKDIHQKFNRLEGIIIKLIDQQKKMQIEQRGIVKSYQTFFPCVF